MTDKYTQLSEILAILATIAALMAWLVVMVWR